MSDRQGHRITRLLGALACGEVEAEKELVDLTYSELSSLASALLRRERPGYTLQTSDLVSEVYLRLFQTSPQPLKTRAAFFGAASKAMMRILVDHARRKYARKRDPKRLKASHPLDTITVPPTQSVDIIALSEAMERLAQQQERKELVVRHLYILGHTVSETAELLGLSPRTVDNDWRVARAWLHREMTRGE